MSGPIDAWYSRFPEGWWGYHWELPTPMSAVELIGTPAIDARLMATLWAVVERHDPSATRVVGVLEPDERGAGGVRVRAVDDRGHRFGPQDPVERLDGAQRDAGQGRRAAALVADDVRRGLGDHFVPGAGEDLERRLVAHRAGRDEEPGLLAEQLGAVRLEGDGGRVGAPHVVPDLGVGHRPAHLGRRGGERVGAQLDEAGWHGSRDPQEPNGLTGFGEVPWRIAFVSV